MDEMTVGELIELLGQFDQDSKVRFASQPSWPFEYSIKDVIEGEWLMREDEMAPDGQSYDLDQLPVVYLVEGRQVGYLPREVKEQLGW